MCSNEALLCIEVQMVKYKKAGENLMKCMKERIYKRYEMNIFSLHITTSGKLNEEDGKEGNREEEWEE